MLVFLFSSVALMAAVGSLAASARNLVALSRLLHVALQWAALSALAALALALVL